MNSNNDPHRGSNRFRRSASGATILTALCGLVLGCNGGDGSADTAAQDTLSRRQKDSIISTLPIPGSGAVGKALDAADAARARAERHDTIR